MRVLPAGFVPPCLPTKAQEPPSGPMWLHEIKHDGFRVVARKDGAKLRLYSRPDNDLTYRFPLIVEALARLRSKSCIIDGEAVACDGNGMPTFDRIRYRRHDGSVFLYAFDLIERNGDDLRTNPLRRTDMRQHGRPLCRRSLGAGTERRDSECIASTTGLECEADEAHHRVSAASIKK
jgi:bifunctional non-homologous end joining protein LigD